MKEYTNKNNTVCFDDLTKQATRELHIGEKCKINGEIWRRIRATKQNEYTTLVRESAYPEGTEPINPELLPRRPVIR